MRRLSLFLLLNIAISINAAEVYIAVEEIWPRTIEMIDVLALESQQIVFIKDSLSFGIFGEGVYQDYYPLNFNAFKAIPKKDSVFIFWNSVHFEDSTEICWCKIYPVLGGIYHSVIPGNGVDACNFIYEDSLGFCHSYSKSLFSLSLDSLIYSGIYRIKSIERYSSDTIMVFLYDWLDIPITYSNYKYYSVPLTHGKLIGSRRTRIDSLYGYHIYGSSGSHSEEYVYDVHYRSCNTSLNRCTEIAPFFMQNREYCSRYTTWTPDGWETVSHTREDWILIVPGDRTYRTPEIRMGTPLLGNFVLGEAYGRFEGIIDTFLFTGSHALSPITNFPYTEIQQSIRRNYRTYDYAQLLLPTNQIVIDYNGDSYDEFVIRKADTLRVYSFYPDFAIEHSIDTPIDLSLFSYPNPFNGIVQFNTHENVIEIYDVKGNLIKTIAPTVDYWKPAENVSSGVYIARTPQNGNQLNTTLLYVK